MSKLYLMSDGLTTKEAFRLLSRKINVDDLEDKRILLIHLEKHKLAEALKRSCVKLGFRELNIDLYKEGMDYDWSFDYIYVTEGNTFEILKFMKVNGLIPLIQKNYENTNCTYIGASSGAMIAGIDIAFAGEFDKNTVELTDLSALKLFDGTIIPHFTKAQLKRFLVLTEPEEKSRYKDIYSVANGRMLMIQSVKLFDS